MKAKACFAFFGIIMQLLCISARCDEMENNLYWIGRNRNGTAAAAIDENHWGIIDESGEWIVPPVYDGVEDAPGVEEITDDLKPLFDQLYYGGFADGFYLIWKVDGDETLFGFYHIPTGVLVEPHWIELWLDNPVQPLLPVCDPDTEKFGYINWHGDVVIPCQYDEAYSFVDGLAATWSVSDGLFHIIDETGQVVASHKEE